MREVVRSGTLADFEDIDVCESEPYAMTMEALDLLIKHCSHLKTWRRIPRSFIWELKH
jgi:hypothetical protein